MNKLEELSQSNTRFLYKSDRSESLLTFLFFSKRNVDNLQNLIRLLVHRETKVVIDKQSNRELLVVMRSIFEQYSRHPPYLDPSKGDEYNRTIVKKTVDEVNRLNEIVLNEIVPKVISMVLQFFGYLKDVDGRRFMDNPENVNIRGERKLRSVTDVLV
jgi:hypothetical protein